VDVRARVGASQAPFAFDNAMLGVHIRRIVSDLAYLTWAVALLVPAAVEPMLNNEYGYYDLEDQYVVTETGRECLHEPAPEQLPVIPA